MFEKQQGNKSGWISGGHHNLLNGLGGKKSAVGKSNEDKRGQKSPPGWEDGVKTCRAGGFVREASG